MKKNSTHYHEITSVSFSSDGQLLASASLDGHIILWDLKSLVYITTLNGHHEGVTSISFNPKNDKILASASEDKSVKIWCLETFREL